MSPSVSAPPVSGVPIELAELIDRLTARIKSGETPDLDAIVSDHPEYADELRRLLPAMKLLADLSRSGSVPSMADGDVPLGDLGDFRLIREVGRGGMGVVYEAEQISLHRPVALKVLPFAATMDPRHLQRFKNEALAAASLRHENIVHVYGVGCERGVHFYAMEFIEGQTLAQLIRRLRGPDDNPQPAMNETAAYPAAHDAAPTAPIAGLSTRHEFRGKAHYRRIAEMIAQSADALEHAHSMGIVHRDVKPGNLLLDAAGKIYISDFGLARLASPGGDAGGELTMSGDLIGTLRYMSPEQALARHGLVDHRTDIYSLGATLYELLTLRPAVAGDDKAEILKQIAWEEPTALRKHDKSIPVELETIALKALAKEPEGRYATAAEFSDDLRHWLGDRAIKAKPPGIRERGQVEATAPEFCSGGSCYCFPKRGRLGSR